MKLASSLLAAVLLNPCPPSPPPDEEVPVVDPVEPSRPADLAGQH